MSDTEESIELLRDDMLSFDENSGECLEKILNTKAEISDERTVEMNNERPAANEP